MRKVIADGTLGVSENDRFIAPAGVTLNLGCTGGDEDAATDVQQKTEDYYFE